MIFRVILCLVLIFSFVVPSFSESEVNLTSTSEKTIKEKKLEEINRKLKEKQEKLEETRKKEQNALYNLVVTKKKLDRTKQNLKRANEKISLNKQKLDKLVSDLETTRQDLEIKRIRFKKRIVEVYKNSSVNYLELLFSARSMADFINRFYFFSKIVELDGGLVKNISTSFSYLRDKKVKLADTTEQIRGLASEISNEKEKILAQAKEINNLHLSLQERRKTYEKQVAELEASSAQLEKEILAKTSGGAGAAQKGTGSLDWPLRGRITSVFGYRAHPLWRRKDFHTGMDIAAPYGEVIRAADSGEIILAGWWNGYGKAIVINHGKDMSTVYGHMSRLYMKVGDRVKKGQIIGLVGSTGYSTGPHLHFEVRIKGKPKNPRVFLP
ncbi:hypothetical protein A2526_02625 [candidate division WOR-1 bacterium RIFOXYD2_FULL_36_8]|uniref:Uncharacterized protein n=1 Tax=candidate division WOR-1 bacterium RIFOXYB2_FULL_36_35 TaxID=1802578 RepID=A0A1F4S3L3_UNCSA|nr:MAG: hypothetical protein A2230_08950 [candidate division WOR-1 bacterium RIFOXYA2_FULL_36_21]OGC15000.1 MAG: hypothetical protein A2290_01590 [candidate division WOR-1 bacterium RIFOXYB2_FULL_36_35]OGC18707.1 MAG: hypothetical protein A2282_07370 [candidate division WOR-1 bacterium RIFOXYA12_FULL_36_13]OGC38688.1 MAG: hypothetical protein A2526_02625 [candidate division WOR-1 bacterium RIFOXYD2_FULL_36_8]